MTEQPQVIADLRFTIRRHTIKAKQMNFLYSVGSACTLCLASSMAIPLGAFCSSIGFTAVAVLAGSLAMVAIFESCN